LLRRDARTPSGRPLACLILRDKLSVIVKHMLKVSDNDSAETLLRMTALAAGRPAWPPEDRYERGGADDAEQATGP
jgi:hypothetical protein